MKKIILCTLALAGTALLAQEYKIDFNAQSNRWTTLRNHGYRLEIKNGVLKKKPATIVTLAKNQRSNVDTAFALVSQKFPVKGKKTIDISGEILIPAKQTVGGSGGSFQNAVHFFDAKGKALKVPFTPFKVPAGTGDFMPFKATVAIPAGAASATIQLGYDYPNIQKNQTFAVSKLVWFVK